MQRREMNYRIGTQREVKANPPKQSPEVQKRQDETVRRLQAAIKTTR